MKRKKKLMALAFLPALGIVALAGSAFAANGTSTSSTTSSFHVRRGKVPHDNTTFANNLASVLGLSAADIKAKLDAGQTVSSIITASGKNPADVMTALKTIGLANMKAKLAAAVASGKITQAKADAVLAHMTNRTDKGHHGFLRGLRNKNNTASSTQ